MVLNEQELLRAKISDHLARVKEKNPSYSLRALARKLDIPAGNLSSFLSSKRVFSAETIEKLAYKLMGNPEERKDILEEINRVKIEKLKQTRSSTSQYESQTLTEEEFQQLDEWYYYAVRSLFYLKDFRLDLSWMAEKIGATTSQVETAMGRMLEMGLIQITEDNRVRKTTKHLKTPDMDVRQGATTKVIRKIHDQSIEQARISLHEDSPTERDITWVNIPSNSKNLDKARELIRKFQDDMLALLEDGHEDEIYRLTIQLCPLKNRSK